jgi:hypothetical protein
MEGVIVPHLEVLRVAPEVCLLDVEHLYGPEEIRYGEEELVVLCLVRNGLPWIKTFVEHYFSLGVKHIVFLDNNSTDDTVAAATRYNDVTVLRAKLPVNAHGGAGQLEMMNYLRARFGRDRWSLCVDIDELFDYPYSDVINLTSLLSYLNAKSFTAVTAQLLDMFPEKPVLERAEEQDEPLKEVHRFYDLSNLERWNKEDRPKMLPRFNNTVESEEVEWFRGGIRKTIFSIKPYLTKYPLVLYDGKTWPDPPHYVYNARIADFTCVLLHYKFLNDYRERTVEAAPSWRNTITSDEYRRYLEELERNPSLRLKEETAREIASVNDLLENGFLSASDDYVDWVNAEEQRRILKDAQDGLDMTVEALLESRRQQRAKTLRLERLERQLLRSRRQEEPKPRRLQQLRSQLRVRDQTIQELERELRARDQRLEDAREKQRRLKRKHRQLGSRIVSLERQLESTNGSLAWRLEEALRRIKVKIVGSLSRIAR